jgi:hypothetical protein
MRICIPELNALEPTHTPVQRKSDPLAGVNRPRNGANQTHLSKLELYERVDLKLYSNSGPSWPLRRLNLVIRIYSVLLHYEIKFVSLDFVKKMIMKILSFSVSLSLLNGYNITFNVQRV